jgi:serine/threonine-protein kinase
MTPIRAPPARAFGWSPRVSSTPETVGRYAIERFLASGGMGDIYLARDPVLGRRVAIKLLREGFDTDEIRERFEREAHAAGRLSHPNLVAVYESGEHKGLPFIAMEYVPGESLAALIRRREPIALSRKLAIVEGVCAGLAHAHRANLVHRDIKPANLIVDPDGGVKVLDFGIVRLAGSGLTRQGVLVGTVNYVSPEQIADAPGGVDHRSDVFAVGAVFYELLAYQRAFPGPMSEVLQRIAHDGPEPLARCCPDLDPAIERAVYRCLDRDPARRYQDLDELAGELAGIRRRLEAGAGSNASPAPASHGADQPEAALDDLRLSPPPAGPPDSVPAGPFPQPRSLWTVGVRTGLLVALLLLLVLLLVLVIARRARPASGVRGREPAGTIGGVDRGRT